MNRPITQQLSPPQWSLEFAVVMNKGVFGRNCGFATWLNGSVCQSDRFRGEFGRRAGLI